MLNLYEYRQKAGSSVDAKHLFYLWEEVCRLYDRGEIGRAELDEMRSLICPTLELLAILKKQINQEPTKNKHKPLSTAS